MARHNLKLSFNPTYDNSYIIEDARRKSKLTLTQVMNNYITYTSGLDEAVSRPILSVIDDEIGGRKNLLKGAGTVQANNIVSQIKQLEGLRSLLTVYWSPDNSEDFQKIKLKKGHLKCPLDWLLINPQDAPTSSRAYVVECLNASRYNIPHYVYFDDLKERNEDFYKKVENEIVKVYPEFQKVIDKQVEAEYEEGEPQTFAHITNLEEYSSAPTIGIFLIETSAEIRERRTWDTSYQPPANAEVVR